ncbi:hypothetical protein [Actinacidiphila glaucinigra]|uniref:hypothetical protein n=1 Tax=Actinacidiphila glaucinigra TaxID=235986 RepID=UPI0037FD922D
MDQERYVPEPNQVLHPGRGARERFNDQNDAVYETTHYDPSGHAFTQNHQLGPAERYGYKYVGGSVPQAPPAHTQPWGQAAGAAAAPVGGAEAYHAIADNYVQGGTSRSTGRYLEEDGDDEGDYGHDGGDVNGAAVIFYTLLILVALLTGPLIFGVMMLRGKDVDLGSRVLGTSCLLMEVPLLAVWWAWLFHGGRPAWFVAAGTAAAIVVGYGLFVGVTLWRHRRR